MNTLNEFLEIIQNATLSELKEYLIELEKEIVRSEQAIKEGFEVEE